jgi:hypothetical protein
MNERKFGPTFTRQLITCLYGRAIPKATWQNWRQWARAIAVKDSFDYLVVLAAIALIRRGEHERGVQYFAELKVSAIRAVADDPELNEQIVSLIDLLDKEFCQGREAAIALNAAYGINVSQRTIYRRVPAFHAQRLYRLPYLKAFF